MTLRTYDFEPGALPSLPLTDFTPEAEDLESAALDGLRRERKSLPCKLFYDERGSRLFDQICELPEYYPTRTEAQITRQCAGEIARAVGRNALLVEYGSGSSLKTRILLDHMEDPAGYVPIDISRSHLMRSAQSLALSHPGLAIMPVCADYTAPFHLPSPAKKPRRTIAYFPGSTIGNFEPPEARSFLRGVQRLCGTGSGLLIGVDKKKDPAVLHAAYNDAAGVTADFNLNLLRRLNAELQSDFDLSAFRHYAFYNPIEGRVEMHLVSGCEQVVRVAGQTVRFEAGESIHTENCYKYSTAQFQRLAASAGYSIQNFWQDPQRYFGLFLLTSAKNRDLPA